MIRAALPAVLLGLLVVMAGCATVPRAGDGPSTAQVNAKLGLNMLGQGHYEQARERLQRALRYDGSNIDANWGMALVHQHLGQPERALDYYDNIIGQDVRPAILNSYAVLLCQQGETEKAIEYFKRAADHSRNDKPAVALANAGLCLERAGNHQGAIGYYRKALVINKQQPTALAQMAGIQYAQGQYLSARGFIERAASVVELNPKLLLLAARIELALGDRDAAKAYLKRHNRSMPSAALMLEQLEQPD